MKRYYIAILIRSYTCLCLPCSKGDIENAVKFLEMFVNVTEKAGLKDSLARACSATGSMYNTLVGTAVLYN